MSKELARRRVASPLFFFFGEIFTSTVETIKCFARSRSGEGEGNSLLEFGVALSGITHLRKSDKPLSVSSV